MTFIIELVFLAGFTLSVDATKLYGIDNEVDCRRMLPMVMLDYKADAGNCYVGNIMEKTENI
jgi:hypothetical protein|tara:strand:- start:711 stop:896 length:186 start_codon:yes stop_codon:yes gene_type:complete